MKCPEYATTMYVVYRYGKHDESPDEYWPNMHEEWPLAAFDTEEMARNFISMKAKLMHVIIDFEYDLLFERMVFPVKEFANCIEGDEWAKSTLYDDWRGYSTFGFKIIPVTLYMQHPLVMRHDE